MAVRFRQTIKFVYKGKLEKWVCGKDLILYTIGLIGVEGAMYKSMEFTGPVIDSIPMSERFTMANMAIEAGGKNGIFHPDKITLDYVKRHSKKRYKLYASDPDAEYYDIIEIDCSKISAAGFGSFSPSNAKAAKELTRSL